jgi:hypothetical protein
VLTGVLGRGLGLDEEVARAGKRRTALARRRKSPCPEVHLAQQLDAMQLMVAAPAVAAGSEDEGEAADGAAGALVVGAERRAGTEETESGSSASAGSDPAESGP